MDTGKPLSRPTDDHGAPPSKKMGHPSGKTLIGVGGKQDSCDVGTCDVITTVQREIFVHRGLPVLAGRQKLRLEPAHLPVGRQVSLVDASCRRSRGLLYDQETTVLHVVRIKLVTVVR